MTLTIKISGSRIWVVNNHKQSYGECFNIVCDISIFICFPFAFIHMFKFHFKRFNCWLDRKFRVKGCIKVKGLSQLDNNYWYSCWCIFLGDIWYHGWADHCPELHWNHGNTSGGAARNRDYLPYMVMWKIQHGWVFHGAEWKFHCPDW